VRHLARRADPRRGAAGWLEWLPKMPFEEMARHSMDFWLSSEDLPRPENRIFYDGDRVVLDVTEKATWRRIIGSRKSSSRC
jgi:hypothetical protein